MRSLFFPQHRRRWPIRPILRIANRFDLLERKVPVPRIDPRAAPASTFPVLRLAQQFRPKRPSPALQWAHRINRARPLGLHDLLPARLARHFFFVQKDAIVGSLARAAFVEAELSVDRAT